MLTNPNLQMEVEDGLYDLATPFMEAEYTMEHLGLPENLQKNIHHQYYDAGHMMYLHDEDQAKLKANIASFMDSGFQIAIDHKLARACRAALESL